MHAPLQTYLPLCPVRPLNVASGGQTDMLSSSMVLQTEHGDRASPGLLLAVFACRRSRLQSLVSQSRCKLACSFTLPLFAILTACAGHRSEERRVGKECRS